VVLAPSTQLRFLAVDPFFMGTVIGAIASGQVTGNPV
jgi:hypothetical protein